jgi:CheY-like chemotaxis protein
MEVALRAGMMATESHDGGPCRQDEQGLCSSSARGGSGPRARILVVEDDTDLREIIVATLSAEGYDVVDASSGVDAVKRLSGVSGADTPFDLVLTDVRMAEMDGLRLARNIRAASYPVSVVLISAFPSSELRAEARRLRAVLLAKPFRAESLREVVALAVPRRARSAPGEDVA